MFDHKVNNIFPVKPNAVSTILTFPFNLLSVLYERGYKNHLNKGGQIGGNGMRCYYFPTTYLCVSLYKVSIKTEMAALGNILKKQEVLRCQWQQT